MAKLQTGDRAPDLELPDQDGTTRTLSELRGRGVLVYFYPRDDTPGCTSEACGLREAAAQYRQLGVEVIGISTDSVKSHKKFADKFSLPFTLLADEEKRAVSAFGAWGKKKFMGREFLGTLRSSFLIDPAGKIAKVYTKVKPALHAEEVLADVAALRGGAQPARAAAPARSKTKAAAPKPAPTRRRGTPSASTARRSKPKG